MGSDCEPIKARKYHESVVFRSENERFLSRYGDRFGFRGKTIKNCIAAFQNPSYIDYMAGTIDVLEVLGSYWGSFRTSDPWGWKDPRNSLTFPIWKRIFPKARPVIIRKIAKPGVAKSGSGHWFRNKASPWLRRQYMHPWWLDCAAEALLVNFEAITSSARAFNILKGYCGLPFVSKKEFEELLFEAEFEGNR